MSRDQETGTGALPNGLPKTVPAPSAALLTAVASMKAVRTRRPLRTFLVVAGASLAYASLALLVLPLRRDFEHLPRVWWWVMASVWFLGFVLPLGVALLPKRHAVIPDVGRAARVAALVALGLTMVGLWLTRDAPPYTLLPQGERATMQALSHCLTFSLAIAVVPLLLAAAALKRVVVSGVWRVGAAAGAAGGALGGLTLHALCPFGGGLHVGLAHGGGVFVGALAGAAIFALFLDR